MKDNIWNENELISVVIPTYNRAYIIFKSIESVLNQTYRNIELIIVDDGSTDDTVKNLRNIKDKRLQIVQLEKNSGMCAARNAGTKVSKGKYIAIHDSDDIWDLEKLEKQYKFMKKTGCDLAFCQMRRINVNGKEQIVPNKDITMDGDLYHKLLKGSFIPSITIMMKNELANKVEFDPEVRRFTDWDFALRVVKANYKISYLPEILATSYIQNDSSAVTENKYKSIEFIYKRYKDEIMPYPDVHAIFSYNLGVNCSVNNRKLANIHFMNSLKLQFSWKVLFRLILNKLGVTNILKSIKRSLTQ